MEPGLHNLEREIERALAALPPLPASAPRPEAVARVRAMVADEARRLRLRGRRLSVLRVAGGVAAAVALAVGLWSPRGGRGPVTDPAAAVGDWGLALDTSGAQLRDTLLDGWSRGERNDVADDVDELFRMLDLSLERFEEL